MQKDLSYGHRKPIIAKIWSTNTPFLFHSQTAIPLCNLIFSVRDIGPVSNRRCLTKPLGTLLEEACITCSLRH